jgi:multiple sugar transport system substrate-binding protein
VLIPKILDHLAEQGDSHTFALPRMERTEVQTLCAMTFIKSMLDQSLTWAEGGRIPASRPSAATPTRR